MKTYVITLSKTFPANHPRKGEPTNFAEQIGENFKKHTIRGNYPFWKKRADQINAGKAVLSIRQWTGKPYASKQVELFECPMIGIQQCDVEVANDIVFIHVDGILRTHTEDRHIIANDGLTDEDFKAWFKNPITGGCIIHFTNLRY